MKPKVTACLADCGAALIVAVEFNGKRRGVRVPNPLWPEIDAAWRKAHPERGA